MDELNAITSKQIENIREEIEFWLPKGAETLIPAHALYIYHQTLKTCNQNINLVADDSFEEFLHRHVLDSLSIFKAINLPEYGILIDIGSGAGFPGIPIKLCLPSISLISVESIAKKANFQSKLIELLGLEGANVSNMRTEELAKTEIRGTADIIVSRALAISPILIELSMPLLKIGGKSVFYKTPDVTKEISSSKNALTQCGGKLLSTYDYQIRPGDPMRTLVIIEKISETPNKYPRNVGIPFKRPL
jgi:16S rRNA (guanine527-N7)-methyltransferase